MIDHIDQRICLIGDGSVSIPLLWCKVPLWVFTLLGSQLTADGGSCTHLLVGIRGLAGVAVMTLNTGTFLNVLSLHKRDLCMV